MTIYSNYLYILLLTLLQVDISVGAVLYHNDDYLNSKDSDVNCYTDSLEYTPQISAKKQHDTLNEIDDMLEMNLEEKHSNLLSFETQSYFDRDISDLIKRTNATPNKYDICTSNGGKGGNGDNSGGQRGDNTGTSQGQELSTSPNLPEQSKIPQDTKPTDNHQNAIEHVNNHLRNMRAHANAILDELNELESELIGDIEHNDNNSKGKSNENRTTNEKANDYTKGNFTIPSPSDNCIPGVKNKNYIGLATVKSNYISNNSAPNSNSKQVHTINLQQPQYQQNEFQQIQQQKYLKNQQQNPIQLQQFYHQANRQKPLLKQDQQQKEEQKSSHPSLITEWGIPMKTNPHAKFLTQAQEAIRNWKEQIDSCKHLLDSTVAHAVHNKGFSKEGGPVKTIPEESQQTPTASQTNIDMIALQNYKDISTASQEHNTKSDNSSSYNDGYQENSKGTTVKQNNDYLHNKYPEIYDTIVRHKAALLGVDCSKSNYPMIHMKYNK